MKNNPTSLKRIAIITMARNDEFFLNRWVAYYGKIFGEENLYIYLDGLDQKKPSGAGKSNVINVEKQGIKVISAEKRRLNFLSMRAADLFSNGYDLVIGVDADEFLVLDPKIEMNLAQYLSSKKISVTLSGLGLDFAQHLEQEKPFDESKPFLSQREYALIHSRFTKPSIIAKPVHWGAGFHRIRGHNFHIDKNLYLLHFGNINYDFVLNKMKSPDIIARGEIGHYIRNRIRIFMEITYKHAKSGDQVFGLARFIQTIFRPIYSLNKPAMLGINWVIKIPNRFKKIV